MDKKPRIMLIEDDKFISDVYKEGLEIDNFEVIIAGDGETGLELIKKEKPDLILLDLVIPRKSGFEILKVLKGDESLKDIPVIVLSNLSEDSDVKKAIELGAVDYMVKAKFLINEIITKIKFYLEQKAKLNGGAN